MEYEAGGIGEGAEGTGGPPRHADGVVNDDKGLPGQRHIAG